MYRTLPTTCFEVDDQRQQSQIMRLDEICCQRRSLSACCLGPCITWDLHYIQFVKNESRMMINNAIEVNGETIQVFKRLVFYHLDDRLGNVFCYSRLVYKFRGRVTDTHTHTTQCVCTDTKHKKHTWDSCNHTAWTTHWPQQFARSVVRIKHTYTVHTTHRFTHFTHTQTLRFRVNLHVVR